jgi:hypothetical protein
MHSFSFSTFLGVFAKLRKATISLVMSVRPSVCLLSVCLSVVVLLLSLNRLNSNTTTVAYTATKDNPPVFILLF